jgi:hypothetical protein
MVRAMVLNGVLPRNLVFVAVVLAASAMIGSAAAFAAQTWGDPAQVTEAPPPRDTCIYVRASSDVPSTVSGYKLSFSSHSYKRNRTNGVCSYSNSSKAHSSDEVGLYAYLFANQGTFGLCTQMALKIVPTGTVGHYGWKKSYNPGGGCSSYKNFQNTAYLQDYYNFSEFNWSVSYLSIP